MSDTAHTPGSWIVGEESVQVLTADGRTSVVWEMGGSGRQREANARLIAAAPDLLAALKRIADHECQCCAGDCGCGFRYEEWARAAIAKAEGK